ncbi:hypothetical protein V5O48_007649 [Marasmius crinis-equi]|uniref:Uncharacterized protein n=1 Tax=Marasmius crinis-equi TaxID=585013 RepID=A0ABR3FG74_9AGAR
MALNIHQSSPHPSSAPEDAFPTPQYFPLSSIPPDARDSFDDATMQTKTEAEYLPAVMLRNYVRYCALPACLRFGQIPIGSVPKFLTPWPEHPELKKPEGTRVLEGVSTYDKWNFARSVRSYIDSLPAFHIGAKEATRLRLPCDGYAELDEDEVERFSFIDGIDQLLDVVQRDVLRTVCECIRIIERMPPDAPLFKQMQFRRATHLCTAHNARWDILAMCSSLLNGISVVIVVVPPWEVSAQALKKFTIERKFPDNILDSLPVNPLDISDKLWAVAHDVCYEQGKFFVVTNYTHWTFGRFSNDWKQATVTPVVEARTVELEGGGFNAGFDCGANVFESLIYWIQLARSSAPPVMGDKL